MASTRTYLDYLNDKVEIAPTNSQEELDAAQLLESLMAEHGLETQTQEFAAPGAGNLPVAVVYVVLFVGMLLCGILGTGIAAFGFLLVFLSVALLALRFGGRDLIGGLGPEARSQNVIGLHRASGPLVMKGNRPIVIVAHYDTPNESLLTRPQFARWRATLMRSTLWTVAVVALCALLQAMGFVPAVARHVFWVVGVLAAVPTLLLGVDAIYSRFAECTLGANDNKASLAAMMGVLDTVRPAEDAAKRYAASRPARSEVEAAAEVEEAADGEAEVAAEVAENTEVPKAEAEPAREPEGEGDADAEPESEPEAEQVSPIAAAAAGVTEAFGKVRDGVLGLFRRGAAEEEAPADESPELLPLDGAPVVEEAPSVVAVPRASEPAVEVAVPEVVEAEDAEAEDEAELADDEPSFEEPAAVAAPEPEPVEPEPVAEPAPAPVPAPEPEPYEEPKLMVPPVTAVPLEAFDHTVRRGARFIQGLHMLPDNCEIVYQIPPRPAVDPATLPQIPEMPTFAPEDFMTEVEVTIEEPAPAEPVRTGYVPSFFANEIPVVEPVRTPAQEDEPLAGAEEPATFDEDPYGTDEVLAIPTAQELLDAIPVAEYELIADDEPVEDAEDEFDAEDVADATADAEPADVDETAQVPVLDASVVLDASEEAGEEDDLFEYDDDEDDFEDVPAAVSLGERVKGFFAGIRERFAAGSEPADEDFDEFDEPEDEDDAPEAEQPAEADAAKDDEVVSPAEETAPASTDPEATIADLVPADRFVPNELASDEEVAAKDATGLDTLSEDGSVSRPAEVVEKPAAIDDPQWGTPEFAPKQSNIARRAVLFDLPDPSELSRDPLADSGSHARLVAQDLEVMHRSNLGGRDDAPKRENRRWKGGATNRADLRVVDGGLTEEQAEDLRSQILGMSEDELLSHDIYFVALGGSKINHAGMREFLAHFRKQIRGAFLINLDSVGAGELTVLTAEGSSNTRRADRRLVRLVTGAAKDLHIGLGHRKYDWAQTDATPAMQAAVRSVTLMGTAEDGTPALSGSLDDVPQNVDPAQVVDVAELVTEVIRRA